MRARPERGVSLLPPQISHARSGDLDGTHPWQAGYKGTGSLIDTASASLSTACWLYKRKLCLATASWLSCATGQYFKDLCCTSIESTFNFKVFHQRFPLSFAKALYTALPKTREKPISAIPPGLWSMSTCSQQQWGAWPHLAERAKLKVKNKVGGGVHCNENLVHLYYEKDSRRSATILWYTDKRWFSCRS